MTRESKADAFAHGKQAVRDEVRVTEVTGREALAALAAPWEALCARDPEAGFFLSWRWMSTLLAESPGRWRVLAAWRGSVLVALLPLSETRTRGQRQFGAAGRLAWSEYTGIICDPVHEAPAVGALARYAAGLDWTRLSLRYAVAPGRVERFAASLAAGGCQTRLMPYRINGGETDCLRCPRVALPDSFDTYLVERLSANTRQKVRRLRRKHLETGEFRITDGVGFERDLDVLLMLWAGKWGEGKSEAGMKRANRKFREFFGQCHAVGALYLPVLWREETPLGALGVVTDARTRYALFKIGGRVEAPGLQGVGQLLHAHVIERLIGHGYKTYDFGHGDEPYKYSYGAEDRKVCYLVATRD